MTESIHQHSYRTRQPVQWQQKKCHYVHANGSKVVRNPQARIDNSLRKGTYEEKAQKSRRQCQNQHRCEYRAKDQKYARFQDVDLLYNNGSSQYGKKREKVSKQYKPKPTNPLNFNNSIRSSLQFAHNYEIQQYSKQTESTYTQANQPHDPLIITTYKQQTEQDRHTKQQYKQYEIQQNFSGGQCDGQIKKYSGIQRQIYQQSQYNVLEFQYDNRKYWICLSDFASFGYKLQGIMCRIRKNIDKNRNKCKSNNKVQQQQLALKIIILSKVLDRLRHKNIQNDNKDKQRHNRNQKPNKNYKSYNSHEDHQNNVSIVQKMLDQSIDQYAAARTCRLKQLVP